MGRQNIEVLGRTTQGTTPIAFRWAVAPGKVLDIPVHLAEDELALSLTEPVPLPLYDGFWLYRNLVVRVNDPGAMMPEELALRIKHSVVRAETEYTRLRREVDAFESIAAATQARREAIAPDIQLFVWQRDQGKCLKCGSQERLEFDHVIPISLGGANTARNIQLLCESCNRAKGAKVGG